MKRTGEVLVVFGVLLMLVGLMIPSSAPVAPAAPPPQLSFVYFGASWCQPCERMKRDTLANPKVKAELDRMCGFFVTVLDIDIAKTMARDYRVVQVPTYFILQDGEVVLRAEGYKSPGAFLQWLKQVK